MTGLRVVGKISQKGKTGKSDRRMPRPRLRPVSYETWGQFFSQWMPSHYESCWSLQSFKMGQFFSEQLCFEWCHFITTKWAGNYMLILELSSFKTAVIQTEFAITQFSAVFQSLLKRRHPSKWDRIHWLINCSLVVAPRLNTVNSPLELFKTRILAKKWLVIKLVLTCRRWTSSGGTKLMGASSMARKCCAEKAAETASTII